MIDLATIGPVPVEGTVEHVLNVQSETGCDEGFAGAYSPQETPVRRHPLVWPSMNRANVATFLDVLWSTSDGNLQVMFTPPADGMKTILGRLEGPFSIRYTSANQATVTGTLREDV